MTSNSNLDVLGRVNGDLTVIRFRITCQRQAVDRMRAQGQDTQRVELALDELTRTYRETLQVRDALLAATCNRQPRGQGQ